MQIHSQNVLGDVIFFQKSCYLCGKDRTFSGLFKDPNAQRKLFQKVGIFDRFVRLDYFYYYVKTHTKEIIFHYL